MATVQWDIIDGTLTDSAEGLRLTRRAKVSGVTGDADQRLLNARLALAVNTGTPHPSIAGLYVIDMQVNPIGAGIFDATVNYGPSITSLIPDENQPPQISVGSSVQSQETNLDINGDVMRLDFTINDVDADGNPVKRKEEFTGTVSIQVPQTVMRFTRRENLAPYVKSLTFTGKVNSNTFLGMPPITWLCTRIEGDSGDGGQTYTVNYEFQHNPATWDATIVAKDPSTAAPPRAEDVIAGEYIKTYAMYEAIDFGGLNLYV